MARKNRRTIHFSDPEIAKLEAECARLGGRTFARVVRERALIGSVVDSRDPSYPEDLFRLVKRYESMGVDRSSLIGILNVINHQLIDSIGGSSG